MSDSAHGRMYRHIEETVGRRAADEFDDEHRPVECGTRFSDTQFGELVECVLPKRHKGPHE